jgi:hypothetical protein
MDALQCIEFIVVELASSKVINKMEMDVGAKRARQMLATHFYYYEPRTRQHIC